MHDESDQWVSLSLGPQRMYALDQSRPVLPHRVLPRLRYRCAEDDLGPPENLVPLIDAGVGLDARPTTWRSSLSASGAFLTPRQPRPTVTGNALFHALPRGSVNPVINDFSIQVATVNGSGSQTAN